MSFRPNGFANKTSLLCAGLVLGLSISCSSAPLRPTAATDEGTGDGDGVNGGNGSGNGSGTGTGKDKDGTDTISGNGTGTNEPTNGGSGTVLPGTGTETGTDPGVDPVVTPKISLLFIGGSSSKIDVYKFNKSTGATALLKSNSTPGANPTFLAVHPKKKLLYAADETGSTIMAFSIDPASGVLKVLNSQPMPGGPAHVSVDPDGKFVFAATYGSGHAASFPIASDGKIGTATGDLFVGMNAHAVHMSPNKAQLWIPCLGSNYIAQYSFSASGQWTPASPATVPIGTGGPRHMASHPNGKWAYLMNELSSSVQALTYDGSSLKLNGTAVSALSAPVGGNSGAEIQVHPAGKIVYSSNRGDNSIAIFSIAANGEVSLQKTVKSGGKTPRHFALDESGNWMTVANQTGGVSVFSVNATSGDLTAKGSALSYDTAQYAEIFDFAE
ncbi:MAG: lactonase family protein [Proteobacteria bacterium]|nr:MAG: lactonase family protein [Pseudomonadota bacterium]